MFNITVGTISNKACYLLRYPFFLTSGKLPPTYEGIKIFRADKLLGIANILHIAAISQCYIFYILGPISRHAVSSERMIWQVRKEVKINCLKKQSKKTLQQNEHHPIRISLKSSEFSFPFFHLLVFSQERQIPVSALQILVWYWCKWN